MVFALRSGSGHNYQTPQNATSLPQRARERSPAECGIADEMCRGEFQAGCRLVVGLVLCSLSLPHAAGFIHANTQWSSAPRHTPRHRQAVSKVKLPPAVLTVTAAFMYGTYEDPFVCAYEAVRRQTMDRTIVMYPVPGMQNWALGAMRGALAPSEFKPQHRLRVTPRFPLPSSSTRVEYFTTTTWTSTGAVHAARLRCWAISAAVSRLVATLF